MIGQDDPFNNLADKLAKKNNVIFCSYHPCGPPMATSPRPSAHLPCQVLGARCKTSLQMLAVGPGNPVMGATCAIYATKRFRTMRLKHIQCESVPGLDFSKDANKPCDT